MEGKCVMDHLLLELSIGLHIDYNLCKVVLNAILHINVQHVVTFDNIIE